MHQDSEEPSNDSHGELPPVRRSFPVPKRRPVLEEEEPEEGGSGLFAGWLVKSLVGLAVALSAAVAWVRLGPSREVEPAPAPPRVAAVAAAPVPVIPAGPPDAARDIYVTPEPEQEPAPPLLPEPVASTAGNETASGPPQLLPPGPTTPAVAAVEKPPATGAEGEAVFDMLDTPLTPSAVEPVPDMPPEPVPPVVPAVLGDLEQKYVAALQREAAAAPEADKPAWNAEISRVQSGQPLPETTEGGLPETLARLQGIYRREKERPATPVPGARYLDFYVFCDADIRLLLNGTAKDWASVNAGVRRITLSLKPGDILGFELPSNRAFAVVARSGVLQTFASRESWEAVTSPAPEFWTGGKVAERTRVFREKPGFKTRMTYFEQVAKAHSSDYSLIWGQGSQNVGFRYQIRKIDLPEKK
jgi:hypothetical protein